MCRDNSRLTSLCHCGFKTTHSRLERFASSVAAAVLLSKSPDRSLLNSISLHERMMHIKWHGVASLSLALVRTHTTRTNRYATQLIIYVSRRETKSSATSYEYTYRLTDGANRTPERSALAIQRCWPVKRYTGWPGREVVPPPGIVGLVRSFWNGRGYSGMKSSYNSTIQLIHSFEFVCLSDRYFSSSKFRFLGGTGTPREWA